MKLVYMPGGSGKPHGDEVKIGDHVTLTHNEPIGGRRVVVVGISKPLSPASTGRVSVVNVELAKRNNFLDHDHYYPSVIGAGWIEREDQGWVPPHSESLYDSLLKMKGGMKA